MILRLVIITLLLSACSTQPPVISSTQPANKHHQEIPSSWKMTAKLGIRTENDSGSVNLQWQQKESQYFIQTSAALGQGKALLEGNDKYLILKRPGKDTIYTDTPEILLKDVLGWSLPLQQLQHWVTGEIAPRGTSNNHSYSPEGLLTTFEQGGWLINYSRYKIVENWALPHKIVISDKANRLTLIIKKWQFDLI